MSNLVLVTLSASHGAVTQTKAMLEGLGHTVTVVLSSAARTNQLVTYDLIVWCRGDDNAIYSAEVVGAVDQGTPLICATAGAVTTFNYLPVQELDLITASFSQGPNDPTQSSISVLMEHELINGLGSVGSGISVYPSNTYLIPAQESKLVSGAIKIAASASDNTTISLALFPMGTLNSQGNPIAATVSFVPWVYGLNGYTAAAKEIIRRLILLSLAGSKVISGVITDSNGNPAQRNVIAVNLLTNKVSFVAQSDITGAYSLTVPDTANYAVVCVDDVAAPMVYVA
ncbi:hypothetical protein CXF80_18225 [Shewanella sp. Actino-trap-3]|uniref:hypothetical protein n=1 Tax=Shewanella sp. Actino-trap-3 TaxID=2058331 RepID=UPI000C31DFD4|nr:hypothetical protein [Shewanella sp. Actino-trap-3]PKG80079.1 hypothetical protein CXF80_18225 [Shewanella sp. Actino-trap-3]